MVLEAALINTQHFKVWIKDINDMGNVNNLVKDLNSVALSTSYAGIGLMSRVLTNTPGDWYSIRGRVVPKT